MKHTSEINTWYGKLAPVHPSWRDPILVQIARGTALGLAIVFIFSLGMLVGTVVMT